MIQIIFIAISLAMDCLAVAIAGGVGCRDNRLRLKYAFKIAAFFSLFQMIMPLIGYAAGYGFKNLISRFDHWIAFGLLAAIGIKMIYEGAKGAEEDKGKNIINNKTLLILSLATSIDALAVGISFGIMDISLLLSILMIGAFAFILSFIGFYLGNKAGRFFKGKIEIVGGVILILIGIKILIEHLFNFDFYFF
ncbi:MAG: manganese efflux pump MntP family protein [Actinomycetota bacterium]|jgi:putative Mn2+ efflux pump MntP|nr:manganese efflux pump MntP family protein [Actinomycetota bacterium]